MNAINNARSRVAAAMITACREWPMASGAILSMQPVERSSLPFACAVDQYWRLYHNPAMCDEFSRDEFVAVILHEVCHLILRHHRRAERFGVEGATQLAWNLATDFVINEQLRNEGKKLPKGCVFAEDYGLPPGKTPEWYFRELLKQQEQEQEQQQEGSDDQGDQDQERDEGNGEQDSVPDQSGDEDGQGNEAGDGRPGDNQSGSEGTQPGEPGDDSQGDEGDASPDSQPSDGDGQSEGANDGDPSSGGSPASSNELSGKPIGAGGGGSASDGVAREWELPPPSEMDAATEDIPGVDEGMADQIISKVAERIESKAQGTETAFDRFFVDDVTKIHVDPRHKLMKLIRASAELAIGHGERTYRRPSRRNSTPFARPSNVMPIPRFTVIVDTSGSMGSYEMALAMALINKLLESFRIRDGIKIVYGDTEVKGQEMINSNVRQMKMIGRGGTRMEVVITQALAQKPKPQMILCVTDGYTEWPAQSEMEGVPLVACVTTPERTPDYVEDIRLFS